MGQFVAFANRLRRYFAEYGGWSAILASPLFGLALFTTVLGYSDWLQPKWVELAYTLLPSLLGFSLGTYAILFSLMTSRIKRALKAKRNDRGVPYLLEINATFFHFIFVQVVALMWAFLYSGSLFVDIARAASQTALSREVGGVVAVLSAAGSFVGMLLLVYSVLLVLGAALAVYRIASIVDPVDG